MFQTTRLSKVLAAILAVAFTVELFVPDTSDYLALVPGRTLPCVWNLVTCGLLTVNPVELAISIVGLLALARVVEPVYGSKEFLKFVFIVDLLIASVVFAFVYVAYAITTSGTLLYHQFSGFHGVIAALLVAVKQIMPLHELKLFGSFKLKVKYLPSVILLIVIGASVGLKRVDYLAFYIGGTYLGWIYLRFFQQQPDSNVYGDASEDFKFSSFFPEFLAPPIDVIAGVLGFITRLRHSPGDGQPVVKSLHSGGGPSVLGADVADANRRRERGAKALEERLGLKTAGATPTAGSGGDVEAGGGAATTSNQ